MHSTSLLLSRPCMTFERLMIEVCHVKALLPHSLQDVIGDAVMFMVFLDCLPGWYGDRHRADLLKP